MPIDVSFHFVRATDDDYILDAEQAHSHMTVSDLHELSNHMMKTTGGDPIVVVARHHSEHGEYVNAYLIGNSEQYVAVNVCGTDASKFYGVVPLLDFERDYDLYLDACAP